MGNEADLLFTIPVGMPFWGLEDHKPIIVALFLPIVSRKECRDLLNVREINLAAGTVRALDREYNR